jgi:hypothetical protein
VFQLLPLGRGDQPIRPGHDQVVFAEIAGVGEHLFDGFGRRTSPGPASVQRLGASGGGGQHRFELFDIDGGVGDFHSQHDLVFAHCQLGVVALNPALPGRHPTRVGIGQVHDRITGRPSRRRRSRRGVSPCLHLIQLGGRLPGGRRLIRRRSRTAPRFRALTPLRGRLLLLVSPMPLLGCGPLPPMPLRSTSNPILPTPHPRILSGRLLLHQLLGTRQRRLDPTRPSSRIDPALINFAAVNLNAEPGILLRIDPFRLSHRLFHLLPQPRPAPVRRPRRVRRDPGAVHRDHPNPSQTRLTSQLQHPHKQLGHCLIVGLPEPGDRGVIRRVLSTNHPKRHIGGAQLLDPPRRALPMGIAINHQTQQHPRVIALPAHRPQPTARLEPAHINLVQHRQQKPDEMLRRQPIPQIRRQQHHLIPIHRPITQRHDQFSRRSRPEAGSTRKTQQPLQCVYRSRSARARPFLT